MFSLASRGCEPVPPKRRVTAWVTEDRGRLSNAGIYFHFNGSWCNLVNHLGRSAQLLAQHRASSKLHCWVAALMATSAVTR
jgi:hypothetical protein